jgi:hypothetical protein
LIEWKKHSSVPDVRSFKGADCDTDHYQMVAKVRETVAMSKETTYGFHMEGLKK